MDENATSHTIGVVFDGIATDKEVSSRDSRYNSAVRYYDYLSDDASLVIVVLITSGNNNLAIDNNGTEDI